MSKITTIGTSLLIAGIAVTAFAKGPVSFPRINPHATSAATSTKPGVHLVPGNHAKKPVFKTFQGMAKSVSADSLTLTVRKTDYTVTPSAKARIVNRIWKPIALADIQAGDKVRAFGAPTDTSLTADVIRDISLPTPESSATTTTVHAPRIRYKDGSSTNWSGYAVETNLASPQSNAVSDVKGSWIVPGVTCGSTNTYSASWVGIDGDNDNTVEQTGTEQDCVNGSPSYYAWFEMYPKLGYKINLSIHAGDAMSAEVKYLSGNKFQLILNDMTTGKTFATTQTAGNALRQSAEWIMEAPWSGGVLPLANFGTMQFTSAQTTLRGHTGTISDASWQNDQITMVNSSGSPKATPSSLSPDGSSFSVTWNSSN